MKIVNSIDKEFAIEAELEQVVLEVVGIAQIDGRLVGVDDGLDWVDRIAGVAEVNDRLDRVNEVVGVADRVDIHRVINLSCWDTSVAEWQIAEVEFEIRCLEY